LCHPTSLLVHLLGMPEEMRYVRSAKGAGVVTFTYPHGPVACIGLTVGASLNGGMERTVIVSDRGQHITVENNLRVSLHRTPPDLRYGATPDFFQGTPADATAVWEPEFSLGNLYNKGLFLLGYYNEVNAFARAILEDRAPAKGTLAQARQVTRIFEGFLEGRPDERIALVAPSERPA